MDALRTPPSGFPGGLLGGKGWVRWVPKGVVGLISPWNYPVFLVLAPLIDVLAAGNRAMIKPSENSPITSALLAELMAAAFDNTEIAVVQGGVAAAKAFAQMPFDHLVCTGSTEVGRAVMAAASENLVPVTLELGGKCPAILGRSARLAQAVEHIVLGKLINSGQMCMGVDFAWVPAERMDEFVAAVRTAVITLYPGLADNPDYASMINQDYLQRLLDMVAEARRDGARVVSLNTGDDDPLENDLRKLPPTLVVDPDDGLRLMREEIFGPVLPIKGYQSIDDVLAWHDANPAPLALYYFGTDRKEQARIVSKSRSGGVTVNGVIAHGVMAALPFGGVGESGMGVLHGRDGFRTFSHPRAILEAPRTNLFALMGLRPSYGKRLRWMIRKDLRR